MTDMSVPTMIANRVRFIGEQIGDAERELFERILPILSDDESVARCYLARVTYESPSEFVALCIRGGRSKEVLVKKLGERFSSMFGRDQSLDILFLDESQELEISNVCSPFYKRVES